MRLVLVSLARPRGRGEGDADASRGCLGRWRQTLETNLPKKETEGMPVWLPPVRVRNGESLPSSLVCFGSNAIQFQTDGG
jgi:hypothetical protein